jgi:phospholipid-binding lipoprotein MlaA
VFDPLSGYNRVMTRVNDRLYYWVLKPVARGYGAVVPKLLRRGIDNVFENLGFPVRFVNNVLQLKVHGAGVETARFLVNSTIGIAGLWDPASQLMKIEPRDEDFGQTLGRYGIGGGFHVVLPVFGPSNVRDTVGRVADGFLNPVAYVEDSDAALAISIVDTTNATSLRIGEYEALTGDAIDLYALLRDGYEQYRIKKIKE